MSFVERALPSKDGTLLSLRIYEASSPKAVAMCIHGMEEHQARYEPFAAFLQHAGYTVVTADLRGHGPKAAEVSHIAEKNGDRLLLEDEEAKLVMIKREWPGIPVILFAHSMGTIIGRVLLKMHSSDFAAAVLSGYPNPNPAAGAGAVLAGLLRTFKGGRGHSRLIDGMVTGPFSKAVLDRKSDLDWLSVNPDNVRKYIEDPLCGVPFTLGSYHALFRLIQAMADEKGYQNVKKDLPILLISGSADPCTGGEKGRADSENLLRKAGFNRLTVAVLDGMRHEILNETEREAVCRRILEFIGAVKE